MSKRKIELTRMSDLTMVGLRLPTALVRVIDRDADRHLTSRSSEIRTIVLEHFRSKGIVARPGDVSE